ncbi:MAG: DUF4922 domain-containing protein [Muribaculaceae bacterium]|nr:DUF4922 domain-containing protein [Muribaculaceae bacterium]
MTIEDINDFLEYQLEVWPEARKGFEALKHAERKPLPLGDLDGAAQCNPARIRSTAAKTDPESIRKRACFLCADNRPPEQIALPFLEGWEMLVNPYPILPVHFTIAATEHRPQGEMPLDMAAMAEKAPDLVFFYNGARAGASAPDHQHCQAVLKSELPLVRLIEAAHTRQEESVMTSPGLGLDLPFTTFSAIVPPGPEGMKVLLAMSRCHGTDKITGEEDAALVNAFFWIDSEGYLRILVIPRSAHRPDCFFKEGEEHFTVSPGAIDMAGLLILPDKNDFDRMTPEKAREIYAQTGIA